MQTMLNRPATAALRRPDGGHSASSHAGASVRPTRAALVPHPGPLAASPVAAAASFNNVNGPWGGGYSSDPWAQRRTDPWGNSRPAAASSDSGNSGRVESVRDFDGRYGSNAPAQATAAPPPSPPEAEPSMAELLSELSPEEQNNVRLFQSCSRSVVNVATTSTPGGMFGLNMLLMPRGVGSGFIWDREGHVITNAHVIRGAETVSVTLADQTVHTAKVIGKDVEKDVAVLKLELSADEKAKLTPLTIGSSSRLLVGQKVVAIGNPFSLDTSCTQGIVSGLGREINAPPSMNGYAAVPISGVIQTDAAINPGNSGGPLLDGRGRVVGINTAIASVTGASNGVGFAIPIDAVKGLVQQILTHGRTMRPALGISLAPPTFYRQAVGAYERRGRDGRYGSTGSKDGGSGGGKDSADDVVVPEGVLVLGVRAGGPADMAGVQPTRREVWGQLVLGDVITGVDGKKVKTQKDLFAALDQCRVGQTVELALSRGSVARTVRVQLADREQLAAFE